MSVKGFLLNIVILIFVLSSAVAQDTENLRSKAFDDVKKLSSPAFRGRGYLEGGNLKAAEYISDRFKKLGIQPYGTGAKNLYFQYLTFTQNLIEKCHIKLDKVVLRTGTDYILQPSCPSVKGVFRIMDAGYGTETELNNADSIKGKWVVFKTGLPDSLKDTKNANKTAYTDKLKIEKIKASGGKGVIILKKKLTAVLSEKQGDFPVMEMIDSLRPKDGSSLEVAIVAKQAEVSTPNVLACIPGTGKPILIGAHFDHLGLQGKAVFYGANDNASGTAFLLALADTLQKIKPNRAIIFCAFTGEEAGLKGSEYFTEHPLLPLDSIAAMFNFDLMGNGDKGITVVNATEEPELFSLIKAKNDSLKIGMFIGERGNAPNSDHYPFTTKNVPAVFTYTLGGPPHYHDVQDSADKIRFPVFNELLALFVSVILSVN